LYVLSFFLPAAELGTSNQLEPGWKAAEVAYVALLVVLSHPALDVMIVALWGLTNVLMLLSPIPVIRARRPKSVTLACLAMTIATVRQCTGIVGPPPTSSRRRLLSLAISVRSPGVGFASRSEE